MDEIDAHQQTQIDKLEAHAEINKTTDFWQWLMILAIGVGLLLYLNIGLVSVLNSQATMMQKMMEKCK